MTVRHTFEHHVRVTGKLNARRAIVELHQAMTDTAESVVNGVRRPDELHARVNR